MISFYKEFGPLGYLANYSNHGFTKNGIFYKTVEHYYQSEKYDNPIIKNKIVNAPTPKIASTIGRDRNNKRIANFKDKKLQVMYEGVLEKFRQNRKIAYKLIETRNEAIAEATIDEYFWGIGHDKTGKNHIGNILVKVRSQIKKEIVESILTKCQKSKKVYVLGHQNPDPDSIFSNYLLTNVLKSLNINAYFTVLEEDSDYNKNALISDYLEEKPLIIKKDDISREASFLLVDHNNLENLHKNQVIGAIDHHILTEEIYDTLEIEYASTTLLIYDLFKDIYSFNKKERLLIALAVLADTEYLTSSRYTLEDSKLFTSLNLNLDISYLQKKYFQINDFSLDIKNNLLKDYKEYNIDNTQIKRSIISSYKKEWEDFYDIYLSYIKEKQENFLLIWCDYESKKTYINYKEENLVLDYITTSTNVILKILKNTNKEEK